MELVELNLRNTWLSERSMKYLSENLTEKIQKLCLENCAMVNDENIKTLIIRCKKLKELKNS